MAVSLLVEIGNTSLKWALRRDGVLGDMHAARHEGALPLDVLADWDQLDGIDSLVYSSVGPASVVEAMVRVARARWVSRSSDASGVATDLMIRAVDTRSEAEGVRIAYQDPSRLGVDRFLALVAAHRRFEGPKLIVDAGTAVTFDLLLGDGRHLGGLILPGVRMMRDSLLAGTRIPRYEPLEADAWFATDTGEAIAAASLQAPAATAERLLSRLAASGLESNCADPVLILTGGDAERLRLLLDSESSWVPDLVLQGLCHFA